LNPALLPALLNLAAQYDAEGNEVLAEQYLMKALQANPKSELVHLNMGIHQVRKGMTDAALPHLELALEDGNLRVRAFLYLGIAHKQKQDYETALVHLRKAVESNPRNLSSRLHLAEVYLVKGQDREGRKEIEGLIPALIRDQALFEQVMGLLSEEPDSSGVKVSGRILKPIVLEILEKDYGKLRASDEGLKKTMEKEIEFR
jgi:tetratricopeptide (TPR) repeat protein